MIYLVTEDDTKGIIFNFVVGSIAFYKNKINGRHIEMFITLGVLGLNLGLDYWRKDGSK